MAHGTYTSGKEGKVYLVGSPDIDIEITEWTRDEEADTDRFSTSKTDGEKTSEPGNKGAIGTVNGKLVTESGFDVRLLIAVGTKITLKLGHTSSRGLSQPACVKKISYGVNADTGEMQVFSLDWESTGAATPY